ncbi:TPA: hypothetical protein ACQZDK_005313, partial [Escherichia coli]
ERNIILHEITRFILMVVYYKIRKRSGVSYHYSMKAIRKNKQLLIVTFIYCERNHNSSRI